MSFVKHHWMAVLVMIWLGGSAVQAAANLLTTRQAKTSGTTQTVPQTASNGSSDSFARVDHTHTLRSETCPTNGLWVWSGTDWVCVLPVDVTGMVSISGTTTKTIGLTHCPVGSHLVSDGGWTCSPAESYGQIQEAHLGSTITLTTSGVYYEWITGVAQDCLNATCTSSRILVPQDGEYQVAFSSSTSLSGTNQRVEADLFVVKTTGDAGTVGETEKCSSSSMFGTSDEQSIVWSCLVSLSAGDILKVKFKNETSSGKVVTIAHASLYVHNLF